MSQNVPFCPFRKKCSAAKGENGTKWHGLARQEKNVSAPAKGKCRGLSHFVASEKNTKRDGAAAIRAAGFSCSDRVRWRAVGNDCVQGEVSAFVRFCPLQKKKFTPQASEKGQDRSCRLFKAGSGSASRTYVTDALPALLLAFDGGGR